MSNAPSFLSASHDVPRERSQSRHRSPRRRLPPPPRPSVEDELKSLARESSASPIPSYDPPLRGIIDQNPIILEATVTKAEAARLQEQPCPVEKDTNAERRFVLIPKSDTYSPNETEEDERPERLEKRKGNLLSHLRPEPSRKEDKKDTGRPPIERRRSRQDLPSLETKIPREIPPQYRRSASAYSPNPRDNDRIPQNPFRKSESLLLSPEVGRGSKDYFGQLPSRPHDSHGGRTPTSVADKRASGGSYSARPVTPTSEKRPHGESGTRSRRNTGEKMTRPQQLSAEFGERKQERPLSPHSARSSRSSNHSARRYYSSSEDDIADSGSDRERRRRGDNRNRHEKRRRSPSRSNRSSIEVPKPLSRMTSPLPSPKVSPSQIQRGDPFDRNETFPRDPRNRRKDTKDSREVSPFSPAEDTPRADRLNPLDPRPSKSRQSSAGPSTKAPVPPPHTVPIPIPSNISLHSPGDTRVAPSYDDHQPSASMPPPTAPYWQPPPFQPGNLEKPIGSYRRFSEDIERGSVAPLPSCPRTTLSRGRTDWLTLPQCPGFNICPSCFNSIIAPTEFRHLFIPAPRRSAEMEVLCDFGSSPWYRIAWLLTLKEKRRDLKLFYGLAKISNKVQPCLGKHEAVRQWHSIIDPKTQAPVPGFSVCYSCVESVETLLPPLRHIFVKVDSHSRSPSPRVCSLRFDSKRFIEYFDAFETTADRADYNDADPDMRAVASLARRMAAMPECQHDKELIDRKWYIITQLPEFTVCEECFEEVVEPELEEQKAIPLMFKQTLQRIPKASCQLYSTKMRGIFRLAVDSDDYKLLAAKARERKTLELAYKANVAELRKSKGGPIIEKEMRRIAEDWKKWE